MSLCSLGEPCDVHNTPSDSPSSLFYQALPAIPQLEINYFDTAPFSASFSEFFEDDLDIDRQALVNPDMSYSIEHYTNIKELVPEWDDDEIDEIMVMSPKHAGTAGRLSTILEDASESEAGIKAVDISDFDLFHDLTNDCSSTQVAVCRKRDTNKLYILKRLHHNGQPTWSERTILDITTGLNAVFLPRIYWSFQDDEYSCIVTDFHSGGSLLDRVLKRGPFLPEHILFYASEIAEGISQLHSAGIVHRDLNPENVMIDAHGHIMLTNFACAKLVEPSIDINRSASVVGMWQYQAPEMLLGWSHDFSVDCWSFGMLLYLMVFGMHPFLAGCDTENSSLLQRKILRDAIPFDPIRWVAPQTRDLIVKCLERNPAVRLTAQQIKMHDYFALVNWNHVAQKNVPVPYMPNLNFDESHIRHHCNPTELSQVDIDSGPVLSEVASGISSSPDTFNESSRILHASNAVVTSPRPQNIHVLPRVIQTPPLSNDVPRTGSELDSPELVDIVQDSGCPVPQSPANDMSKPKEIPNEMGAKDHMTLFWETLDFDQNSVLSSPSRNFRDFLAFSLPRLRAPCKKRSFPTSRLSTISTSSTNKLRKKNRPVTIPLFSQTDRQSAELPSGIEKIGSGIGYIYNMSMAADSRGSIGTTVPRTCHGMFPGRFSALGLGLGLGNGVRKTKETGCARVQQFGSEISNVLDKEKHGDDVIFVRSPFGSPWSPGFTMSPTINNGSPIVHTTASSPVSDVGPLTPDAGFFRMPVGGLNFKNSGMTTDLEDGNGPIKTLRLVTPTGLEPPFSPRVTAAIRPVHCHPFASLE